MSNKSFETQKPIKNLKRGLAVGALSVAAMMGPAVANAEAAPHKSKHVPVHVRERQLDKRLNEQKLVSHYKGTIARKLEQQSNGGLSNPSTPAGGTSSPSSTTWENIKNPLMVSLVSKEYGRTHNLTLKDFACGYIDRSSDHAHVKLWPYNPNTDTLVPDDPADPYPVEQVKFAADTHGGLDWNAPFTVKNQQLEPLVVTTPKTGVIPVEIGLEYQPNK